jgi:uncharacterized protein YcaQ
VAYKKKKLVSNTEQTVSTLITPEAQEARMCGLAIGLAEQQLRDGTASSQVIVHYLKLATEKSRRENERLAEENKLLKAKTEALQSAQRSNEQLQEVLDALRSYSGGGGDDSDL